MKKEHPALREQGGLRYRIARPEHGEAIARLLARSFLHEPMSRAVELSERTLGRIIEGFVPECVTNGLSVIAAPADGPFTVAGVFLNHDYTAALPPGFPDRFPSFGPIASALLTVNARYNRQRPGLEPGNAMCLDWGAVDPDGRFAGRGIARVLFQLSVELAWRHGFERCVAECTGHYSQRAARRTGFQPVARVSYRDFVFEGRPVFRSIAAPHSALVLLERVLDGTPKHNQVRSPRPAALESASTEQKDRRPQSTARHSVHALCAEERGEMQ